MPVFYSNHLCVVGSQGQAAAGGASGRMEKRLDSPGRKSETRRVRGLGCQCQTTRSLRDCGSAACTRSPFLLPNSQKHLHAPPPDLRDLWTCKKPSEQGWKRQMKSKKWDKHLSLALTSPPLVRILDELQIEIIKAQTESLTRDHLRLNWTLFVISYRYNSYLFFHYKCTSSTSFGRYTVHVDLRRLTKALRTDKFISYQVVV